MQIRITHVIHLSFFVPYRIKVCSTNKNISICMIHTHTRGTYVAYVEMFCDFARMISVLASENDHRKKTTGKKCTKMKGSKSEIGQINDSFGKNLYS